jgi:hypothetical protein
MAENSSHPFHEWSLTRLASLKLLFYPSLKFNRKEASEVHGRPRSGQRHMRPSHRDPPGVAGGLTSRPS